MTKSWQEKAISYLSEIEMTPDYPMSQLTTFKIGGPLDLLVEPRNISELQRVLDFCWQEDLPWLILGLGSNLLVRDKGIRGIGIRLTGDFAEWAVSGVMVTAGAGVVLGELAKATACMGLTGLEFACGIPGSVGGAVYMNAGAYDGEMAKVITKVQAYDHQDGLVCYSLRDLQLGYRHSRFQEQYQVIVRVDLLLAQANQDETSAKIAELTCKRETRQPLEMPSAGSVFRRPEGYYVGPLIEQAGLKGWKIGGAQVSPKHAGFIVNAGEATAQDVLNLIAHIQRVIRELNGVELIPEIRVIGEE